MAADAVRIGVSGHQGLSAEITDTVRRDIVTALRQAGPVVGVTSLAGGADQLFANCVLEVGGALDVIIPSRRYDESFADADTLAEYSRLLSLAASVRTLDFDAPSEEAYLAAGKAVVDASERMIAIWDGLPPRGSGGTADIVEYAKATHREVTVIWPLGARRD